MAAKPARRGKWIPGMQPMPDWGDTVAGDAPSKLRPTSVDTLQGELTFIPSGATP